MASSPSGIKFPPFFSVEGAGSCSVVGVGVGVGAGRGEGGRISNMSREDAKERIRWEPIGDGNNLESRSPPLAGTDTGGVTVDGGVTADGSVTVTVEGGVTMDGTDGFSSLTGSLIGWTPRRPV